MINALPENEMKKYVLIVILIVASFNIIYAQKSSDDIVIGKRIKIYSKILNEERSAHVYLPDGYENSQKSYPVIYQMDGYRDNFLRAFGFIRHLNYEGKMPEVILVALENTDRHRDCLPIKTEYHATGGGADTFQKVLSEEIIPYVNKNYRTTSYKVLMGFSNTGLFTIYTLFTRPESFDAYLAASPAVAWCYDLILNKAQTLLEGRKSLNKSLSIVYGGREGQKYYGNQYYYDMQCVPELVKIIRPIAPKDFKCTIRVVEEGSHVPYTSIYEGLSALFSDWKPIPEPDIIPAGGLFLKGESISVKLKSENETIRYTLDGTEPTRNSQVYNGLITIDKPATLKTRVFRKNLGESNTVSAEFNFSPEMPAVKNISGFKKGLYYKYFEDNIWRNLPDFNFLKPVKSGIAEAIDLSYASRDEGFALQFKGFIDIAKRGAYRFFIRSNSGCRFLIGDKLIVDNYRFSGIREKGYQVVLESGKHSITVLYVGPATRGLNALGLEIYFEGPGIEKQKIQANILFHKQNSGKF